MDMQETEVIDIFRLVAGILHVGNIQFAENGNYSQIADKQCKTSIYQEIKKQQWLIIYNLYIYYIINI